MDAGRPGARACRRGQARERRTTEVAGVAPDVNSLFERGFSDESIER